MQSNEMLQQWTFKQYNSWQEFDLKRLFYTHEITFNDVS